MLLSCYQVTPIKSGRPDVSANTRVSCPALSVAAMPATKYKYGFYSGSMFDAKGRFCFSLFVRLVFTREPVLLLPGSFPSPSLV